MNIIIPDKSKPPTDKLLLTLELLTCIEFKLTVACL